MPFNRNRRSPRLPIPARFKSHRTPLHPSMQGPGRALQPTHILLHALARGGILPDPQDCCLNAAAAPLPPSPCGSSCSHHSPSGPRTSTAGHGVRLVETTKASLMPSCSSCSSSSNLALISPMPSCSSCSSIILVGERLQEHLDLYDVVVVTKDTRRNLYEKSAKV